MSLRKDSYHLVRKDGELDVGNGRQLVEQRVLTHAQFAGCIGYDAAYHLTLAARSAGKLSGDSIDRRLYRKKLPTYSSPQTMQPIVKMSESGYLAR